MRTFLFCLILLVALGITSCKSNKTASQPEASKPAETKTAKVLIHNSHMCPDCAADGYFFLVVIYATENKWAAQEPDRAKGLSLESTNGLKVTEEAVASAEDLKNEKEKPAPPKTNPKDFDFFIKHEVDYKEQRKKSLNEALKLTVKETWTVESVLDPNVKTTKSVEYTLDGGSEIGEMSKVTEEQLTKVVIPALAPLLKDIRVFIESSSKK